MTRLGDKNKENEHAVNYIELSTCGDGNISKDSVDALCIVEQNQINRQVLLNIGVNIQAHILPI